MGSHMHMYTNTLYSTSWEIESIEILAVLSIRGCTREINSYKVVLFTPYSMTKLFEFQERYVTSKMIIMDMCEILRVLWEKDNKSEFSRIVWRGKRK